MKQRILAVAVTAGIAGCATTGGGAPGAASQLSATKGNTASGSVTFTQRGDRAVIAANLSGLRPNAEHGFHVHEKGDCSSGDGMSAGGHFNPRAKTHAHYGSSERHAGDMPNVKTDAGGNARYSFESDLFTIAGGPASVVGKAVVIHRDPDDYKSQPAGNSGPRIACGVVQRT
ncbi:MAG: superoxide dismutase [Betaproteobacteria bacterium RIFCSPLOWO2_12_FULL_65_14]|nr:MAG: superoxide dismutase [Betaproteobacteria bacterium RIFCSPLOWO2_12_FULL_65_14]